MNAHQFPVTLLDAGKMTVTQTGPALNEHSVSWRRRTHKAMIIAQKWGAVMGRRPGPGKEEHDLT